MTTTINGFSIEPHTTDTFLFKRVAEPQHEYWVKLDPRVELIATVPAAVARGDELVDAKRFEGEVLKAARKYQRHHDDDDQRLLHRAAHHRHFLVQAGC